MDKSKQQNEHHAENSTFSLAESIKESNLKQRQIQSTNSSSISESKLGGKKARNTVIITISAFFFGLMIWSYFAKIQEVATARGKLVSIAEVEFVQHLEGGMIDDYYVSRGDIVQKGDLIATLKDYSRVSQNIISRKRLETFYLTKERLNALLKNKKPNFAPLSSDVDIIESQERLYQGLLLDQKEEQNYFNEIITNKKGVLKSMYTRLRSSKQQLALIQEQVVMRQTLYKKRGSSKLDLTNAKIEHLNMKREVETLKESILVLKDTISETGIQKKQSLTTRRLGYTTEYKEVQTQIAELIEVRKVDLDKQFRLTIRSPVYGVIRDLPVRHSSGVLEASGIIAEIVPLKEGLKSEVHINPKDIGFVSIGQKVSVKLDAYDYSRFGIVNGVVSRISTGTFSDPQTKEVYYLGEVTLEDEFVTSSGNKYVLVPGMEMTADIKIGQRRVIDYIAKPVVYGLNEAFREK